MANSNASGQLAVQQQLQAHLQLIQQQQQLVASASALRQQSGAGNQLAPAERIHSSRASHQLQAERDRSREQRHNRHLQQADYHNQQLVKRARLGEEVGQNRNRNSQHQQQQQQHRHSHHRHRRAHLALEEEREFELADQEMPDDYSAELGEPASRSIRNHDDDIESEREDNDQIALDRAQRQPIGSDELSNGRHEDEDEGVSEQASLRGDENEHHDGQEEEGANNDDDNDNDNEDDENNDHDQDQDDERDYEELEQGRGESRAETGSRANKQQLAMASDEQLNSRRTDEDRILATDTTTACSR